MRKKHRILVVLFVGLMGLMTISSCSKNDDDDPVATVSIEETGSDLGGDVTGDGGSTSRDYTWNNAQTRAEWNMDITSTEGGSFQLIIEDASGNTVMDRTLTAGVGDDSADGVSEAGTPGDWTVRVVLTSFNGDGSFSLSPGG